jgi:hypothetical protein
MEGQFSFRFEIEMELEMIKVDSYKPCGFFDHGSSLMNFFEKKGKKNKKLTVRTINRTSIKLTYSKNQSMNLKKHSSKKLFQWRIPSKCAYLAPDRTWIVLSGA